jgi:hypothetical protein
VLRLPAILTFTDPGCPIGLVAATLCHEGWTGPLRCATKSCSCRTWAKLGGTLEGFSSL